MKRLAACLLLLTAVGARGQQYYDDAQLRTHLSVEKRIKAFTIGLGHQGRFTKNMSTFTRSAFDVSLMYHMNKYVRFVLDYAFIQKMNKYDYFKNKNWYSAAVLLRYKYKRWSAVYRNMFQVRNGYTNTDETYIQKLYDRNKLTIKYELTKRLRPYLAGEVYIPLNDPQWKGINRYRVRPGFELTVTKHQQLELYFMYQQRLNNSTWFDQKGQYDNSLLRRDFIYGVSYGFTF